MNIVFTYNLQRSDREEEAEFDRPETISAISGALQNLGHSVDMLEVSGPATQIVARLEASSPDMIFNIAEGKNDRNREGFFPGLFEQIGLPHTGSDAYACNLTLDKHLTKLLIQANGILTPRWVFVDDMATFTPPELTYPVIVKPNFEGSSKGIFQESIVDDPGSLAVKASELLVKYPLGILIEEYIEGRDVLVHYLDQGHNHNGGIMDPAEIIYPPVADSGFTYPIYDFNRKNSLTERAEVKAPAGVSPELKTSLNAISSAIVKLFHIRDFGRIDFRVTPEGKIYFLEINALPNLDPDAGMLASAASRGFTTMESLLEAIIASAARRHGLKTRRPRKIRKLRVGLAYNLKRIVPTNPDDDDSEAEYDSATTIKSIHDAIASWGHEVIDVEATAEFPVAIPPLHLDAVFNVAEGIKGRNRESQVPAILELLDIPYTGSDPATLSLTLDKGLAKRIVSQAGVLTPEFLLMKTGRERLPRNLRFPVIIKPVAEGSSKGVSAVSIITDESRLRDVVPGMAARYRQPVLVEEFLPGREFTVALLGDRRPKVLPAMEIVYTKTDNPHNIYTFEHKLHPTGEVLYEAPAKLDPKTAKELEKAARTSFMALGCRDVARIDFRFDALGRPNFIECNPLPGLTPGWSDLCLIAEGAGMDYRTLIGEILAPTIRRAHDARKAREH